MNRLRAWVRAKSLNGAYDRIKEQEARYEELKERLIPSPRTISDDELREKRNG